ncbi:MAG: helix-turn-helix domain-containing protein [Bacillota bacterium]
MAEQPGKWVIKKSDINMQIQFPLRVTRSVSETGGKVNSHAHDFHEIGLFLDGGVKSITSGGEKFLPPGTVFIMIPGEEHALIVPAGARSYGINFLMELFNQEIVDFIKVPGMMELFFYHFLNKGNDSIPCFQMREGAVRDFTALLDKIITPPAGLQDNALTLYKKNTFMNALLLLASEYTSRQELAEGVSNNGRLLTVLIAVENLINWESNLIAEEIHKRLDISRSYLFSYFKKKMGITLFEYIIHRKLIRSCGLLYTDKSITEIAQSLGFYDAAHFNRNFKKIFGVAPGMYRENLKRFPANAMG